MLHTDSGPAPSWFIATCWFLLDEDHPGDGGEQGPYIRRRICRLPATSPAAFRELVVWRCLQGKPGTVWLGPVSEAKLHSEK